MKKTILAVVAVCCLVLAKAQTVSSDAASGAARQFINVEEPSTSFASLALCHTFADDNGIPVAYVFNIDTVGFVIVGARMDETPIVGYSLNGAFDISRIPSNLKGWLAAKKKAITTITSADIPDLDRDRIGDPGSPTKVPRMFPPVLPEAGIILDEGSVEKTVTKLLSLIRE